jgi:hypothetical protein
MFKAEEKAVYSCQDNTDPDFFQGLWGYGTGFIPAPSQAVQLHSRLTLNNEFHCTFATVFLIYGVGHF